MDFRASGIRSLKLNIFLILKEVKTNLILRSVSQKTGVLSGADMQNTRSSGSTMLAGKYCIQEK